MSKHKKSSKDHGPFGDFRVVDPSSKEGIRVLSSPAFLKALEQALKEIQSKQKSKNPKK